MNQHECYIGKHLLVGITYLEYDGTFIEQKQAHAIIVKINESEGIVIKLHDSGLEYKLPPDLNSLNPAPKGEYRLHPTNEIVTDPDYLTT